MSFDTPSLHVTEATAPGARQPYAEVSQLRTAGTVVVTLGNSWGGEVKLFAGSPASWLRIAAACERAAELCADSILEDARG